MSRIIAWFSCGASSAVMTKIEIKKNPNVIPVYCDVRSEHEDNKRFLSDCERWFGKEVVIIKSKKYKNVDEVIEGRKYMSGIKGAPCTVELKKIPRFNFQKVDDVQLFGYTVEETKRAKRFSDNNQDLNLSYPLIDRFITKGNCHGMLKEAGIKLPVLYAQGFSHNNCLGCVKSSSPYYWAMIKKHYPKIFEKRVLQSKLLSVKLLKINNIRYSLDELKSNWNYKPEVEPSCDFICQSDFNELLL